MSLFRDPLSSKLTHPNPTQDLQASATHPGMAHFAGTGPYSMTCRQCLHWAHHAYEYRSKTSKYHGLIEPALCRKFKAITGKNGDKVPDDAAACKYFEYNANHPRRYSSS